MKRKDDKWYKHIIELFDTASNLVKSNFFLKIFKKCVLISVLGSNLSEKNRIITCVGQW